MKKDLSFFPIYIFEIGNWTTLGLLPNPIRACPISKMYIGKKGRSFFITCLYLNFCLLEVPFCSKRPIGHAQNKLGNKPKVVQFPILWMCIGETGDFFPFVSYIWILAYRKARFGQKGPLGMPKSGWAMNPILLSIQFNGHQAEKKLLFSARSQTSRKPWNRLCIVPNNSKTTHKDEFFIFLFFKHWYDPFIEKVWKNS